MAEREQIKKQAPSRTEEEVEETAPAGTEKGEKLKAELDELLDGVESIKQTAADTERLLNPLGLKDLNI